MEVYEQLAIKRALEVLDTLPAGIGEGPLFDQVERMQTLKLTQDERARIVKTMKDKDWVYDFKNKLTDRVMLCITEAGRVAMMGL